MSNSSNSNVNQSKQNPRFVLYSSIAGSVSGMVSKFLLHPLDTLKSKLQVDTQRIQSSHLTKHFLRDMIIRTWKEEGVRGFYKGVGISAIGSAPAFSLFMAVYESAKKPLKTIPFVKESTFLQYILAAFSAEFVSCVLWLPIDILKQRQQVQKNLGSYTYKNTFDAIQQMIKSEGVTSLYRGFGATLISFGTSVSLYFSLYEKLKEIYVEDPKNIGFFQSLGLTAVAGSSSGLICNPLFMAKIRLQVDYQNKNQQPIFRYRNVFHGIQQIYLNEGFFALFKGVGTKIIMNTPQKSITVSLMELIRKLLIQADELKNKNF